MAADAVSVCTARTHTVNNSGILRASYQPFRQQLRHTTADNACQAHIHTNAHAHVCISLYHRHIDVSHVGAEHPLARVLPVHTLLCALENL